MADTIRFAVNGRDVVLAMGDGFGLVPYGETLLETLRGRLSLTGTKESCNHGACGCCTVILDGDAVPSCMTLTADCDGKTVTTIEGLEDPNTGELDGIQQAFIDHTAFQCGFCTPGIIMSVKALLMKNPAPTADELKTALSGNYCRCISHYQVAEAVEDYIAKAGERVG